MSFKLKSKYTLQLLTFRSFGPIFPAQKPLSFVASKGTMSFLQTFFNFASFTSLSPRTKQTTTESSFFTAKTTAFIHLVASIFNSSQTSEISFASPVSTNSNVFKSSFLFDS